MGVIDDILSAFTDLVRSVTRPIEVEAERADDTDDERRQRQFEALDAVLQGDQNTGELAEFLTRSAEASTDADEAAGELVEVFETAVTASIQNEGELTPENVESPLNDSEGSAAALAIGFAGLTSLIEAIPLEDIDEGPSQIYDALAVLFVEDLVGRELQATLQEGVDPALKQKIHRIHRSKQADFKDYTEANLRTKGFGAGVDPRSGDIPDEYKQLFSPQDFDFLPDPDTYGTIPDQTPLYELVGLEHLEPEEILEEGPQKGVIPSQEATSQVLETAGLPEDVKTVYREIRDSIPESQDIYQEKTRVGEVVFEVDRRVLEGAMTAPEAVGFLESEIRAVIDETDAEGELPPSLEEAPDPADVVIDELRQKYDLLESLPRSPPSLGDVQAFWEKGIIDSRQFQTLYDNFGNEPEFFGLYLRESAIDQGPEAIRRQFVLGRISGSEARLRLSLIGFTDGEAADILAGDSADSIIQNRLAQQQGTGALPNDLATEIGETRGTILAEVGIDSLTAVAEADVEDLTAVTGMSDTEATQAIQSAQRILEQRTGQD